MSEHKPVPRHVGQMSRNQIAAIQDINYWLRLERREVVTGTQEKAEL